MPSRGTSHKSVLHKDGKSPQRNDQDEDIQEHGEPRTSERVDDIPDGDAAEESSAEEEGEYTRRAKRDEEALTDNELELQAEKHGFKSRDRPRKFFTPGRVFSTPWVEPGGGSTFVKADNYTVGKYGGWIFEKPRKFIVAATHEQHCLALAITSHTGRGAPAATRHEHGIAYTGHSPPAPMTSERPRPGEAGLQSAAIKVLPDIKGDKLNPQSRINYSKLYTVEHYTPVRPFGMVAQESLGDFERQWRALLERALRSQSSIERDRAAGIARHLRESDHATAQSATSGGQKPFSNQEIFAFVRALAENGIPVPKTEGELIKMMERQRGRRGGANTQDSNAAGPSIIRPITQREPSRGSASTQLVFSDNDKLQFVQNLVKTGNSVPSNSEELERLMAAALQHKQKAAQDTRAAGSSEQVEKTAPNDESSASRNFTQEEKLEFLQRLTRNGMPAPINDVQLERLMAAALQSKKKVAQETQPAGLSGQFKKTAPNNDSSTSRTFTQKEKLEFREQLASNGVKAPGNDAELETMMKGLLSKSNATLPQDQSDRQPRSYSSDEKKSFLATLKNTGKAMPRNEAELEALMKQAATVDTLQILQSKKYTTEEKKAFLVALQKNGKAIPPTDAELVAMMSASRQRNEAGTMVSKPRAEISVDSITTQQLEDFRRNFLKAGKEPPKTEAKLRELLIETLQKQAGTKDQSTAVGTRRESATSSSSRPTTTSSSRPATTSSSRPATTSSSRPVTTSSKQSTISTSDLELLIEAFLRGNPRWTRGQATEAAIRHLQSQDR